MGDLPLAEQYAAAELFRGTMVRHSAVVYRDDSPEPQRVSFAGDAWRAYVPLRMSDIVCVQERLPAGAAAVLINRSHTFKDLFLPIDAMEKSLFDAIDGDRSIHAIATERFPSADFESRLDSARSFFERLWWYDQVAIDGSRRCTAKLSSRHHGIPGPLA
jgi:hypothetical protein